MTIVNHNSISGVSTISATTSITVGDVKLNPHSVGIGSTDTTGRNAGISTATGAMVYNSETLQLQVYTGTSWANLDFTFTAKATGGTTYFYSGKAIHVFLNSDDNFVCPASFNETVEYVVVAGGGGGSGSNGGGTAGGAGGAGGYRTGTIPVTGPTTLTVTVGGGGPGGTSTGTNGSPSVFGPITSAGGGRGGYYPGTAGASGGSGGGGAYGPTAGGAGNTPPTSPPQGNDGGPGTPTNGQHGGGGGGAGGAGTPGVDDGHGGLGVRVPTTFRVPTAPFGSPGPDGTTKWFAGGGGGSCNPSGNARGTGGAGPAGGGPFAGAGNGYHPSVPNTMNGATNTGGGAGSISNNDAGTAGAGGSGIVIIAYDAV